MFDTAGGILFAPSKNKFMRKLFLLSLFSFHFSLLVSAQTVTDTSWKKGGFISINLSQTQYNNWAGGGENSLAINGMLNFFENYKVEKTNWENSIDLGYGLVKLADNPMRKSNDKIELNSKYGRLATGKFFYSSMLNFKSQFAPGYNYPDDTNAISKFLAPAYLTVAVGMDYKPTDYFSVFLSPATGKFTFVNDRDIADAGLYGNKPATYDSTGTLITHGKKSRAEFGASLNSKFQKDIFKNVNLLAKLNLFDNYANADATKRGNIDVNFEGLLTLKVNKFLSASISVNVVYDDDVLIPLYSDVNGVKTQTATGKRTQVKDVIGVGLAYKF